MSKESYARGFCKAAAAAGVDPVALAKYAQDVMKYENGKKNMEYPSLSDEERRPFDKTLDAAKKTNSNPTDDDLYALGALSPEVIKRHVRDATVRDYFSRMFNVNPEATISLLSSARSDDEDVTEESLSKKFVDFPEHERILRLPYQIAKEAPDLRPLSVLNYATATNILDKLSQKAPAPLWDVGSARPTPYGLGLTSPIVGARKAHDRAIR